MSISFIREQLNRSDIFKDIYDKLDSDSSITLKKSIGALNSFLIDALYAHYDNTLVISESDEGARFMHADLNVISPDKRVILFPSSNNKPYDNQQLRDTALLVQRSEALQEVTDNTHKIVITSAEAIFEKVAPPSALDEVSIRLKKGEEIDPENL